LSPHPKLRPKQHYVRRLNKRSDRLTGFQTHLSNSISSHDGMDALAADENRNFGD
jgi:hypothetical protein